MKSSLPALWLASACVLVGCASSPAVEPTQPATTTATVPPSAKANEAPAPAAQEAPTQSAVAPGKASDGVTAKCEHWANLFVGPYRYDNNVWGQDKAQGPFEQCLLERTIAGRRELGWTWFWPGTDPGVFAYPEVVFGWKPWGGKPTDRRFPLKVSDVQKLVLHYDIETEATGSYNLAPELWLLESGEAPEKGSPEKITAEIMFWMEHTGATKPAGSLIERPTYDGIEYELYKMENMAASAERKGWTYYALLSPTTMRKTSLAMHSVLAGMVKKGQINPEHYVAGVEFGNEIVGGSGTTWVKRFEVEVEKAGATASR